eukprot:1139582-Pelagomonas_calceolata.AAC.5
MECAVSQKQCSLTSWTLLYARQLQSIWLCSSCPTNALAHTRTHTYRHCACAKEHLHVSCAHRMRQFSACSTTLGGDAEEVVTISTSGSSHALKICIRCIHRIHVDGVHPSKFKQAVHRLTGGLCSCHLQRANTKRMGLLATA